MAKVAFNKLIEQAGARVSRPSRKTRYQINASVAISDVQHTRLQEHVNERLEWARQFQVDRADRYRQIDRDIYGFLVLDQDDKKRQLTNAKGHGIKPVDQKLPLTLVQLDEAVTFLLMILAPEEAIYNAIAPRAKQDIAKAFTALMNDHAEFYKHYRHYAMYLFNCLKYNLGGYEVDWEQTRGNKVVSAQGTQLPEVLDGQILYEGNAIASVDVYNLLYDVSVSPIDLHSHGEFYATVDVLKKFQLLRMQEAGIAYNLDEVVAAGPAVTRYYQEKPAIRTDVASNLAPGGSSDWFAVLSMGSKEASQAYEKVVVTTWLQPKQFGLDASDKFQIWRFTFVNGVCIYGEHLAAAHGWLPIVCGMPWEDDFKLETKSYAELLQPFNNFSSHQLNIAQRSARKKLLGLTFYNARTASALGNDELDLAGGKVPIEPTGQEDFDIRKHVVQYFDAPDYENTLRDIETMDGVMQKILPTDLAKQVASLERATQYQAAATVQGGNRRNLKIGKLLDSQGMAAGRHMQMQNIFQYQQRITLLLPDGQEQQVDPAQFRDANLQFTVSDGLKGLDRLTLVMNIKEVLNSILQSQQAAGQMDIVGLIDYWTSLLGDHTDFKQWKIQSPLDALPAEARNMAYQLLQQALQQQQEAKGGGQPSPLTAIAGGAA